MHILQRKQSKQHATYAKSEKPTQAQRASDELQHNQQRKHLHPEGGVSISIKLQIIIKQSADIYAHFL